MWNNNGEVWHFGSRDAHLTTTTPFEIPWPADTVPPDPEGTTICRALLLFAELLSTTCTVKLNVPATVGVPLMTPPELIVKPLGNDPDASDKTKDPVPPVAETV